MDKQLLSITVGEFIEALRLGLGFNDQPNPDENTGKKNYVYGLAGIAKLFGCSESTAARIKKSGAINAAISQQGKIIVVDADLALELLNVSKRRGGIRGGYRK